MNTSFNSAEIQELAQRIAKAVGGMTPEELGVGEYVDAKDLNDWLSYTWIEEWWPTILQKASERAAIVAKSV